MRRGFKDTTRARACSKRTMMGSSMSVKRCASNSRDAFHACARPIAMRPPHTPNRMTTPELGIQKIFLRFMKLSSALAAISTSMTSTYKKTTEPCSSSKSPEA